MGPEPAHHPHVGLDPVPAQPAAIEDPIVGLDMQLVGALEPLEISVEAVGVLHPELARAQDSGAGTRLIPLLDLDVVEDHRQLPVGADLAGDVVGEVLLVRHRQREGGSLAVIELEELLDRVAAAAFPDLGRLQDRHQHLLAADRIEFLADDLLDPAMCPPAGRQKRPKARAELTNEACSHHQLVRDRLRVGRRLPRGRPEER
jgi:hypothetical protein